MRTPSQTLVALVVPATAFWPPLIRPGPSSNVGALVNLLKRPEVSLRFVRVSAHPTFWSISR